MNKDFIVEICSDLNFEENVADISYKNHTIAMITQEMGIDKMEIELFPPAGEIKSWHLPLEDFIEVVLFAKRRLVEPESKNR